MDEFINQIRIYIQLNLKIPHIIDIRKGRTSINMNLYLDTKKSISYILSEVLEAYHGSEDLKEKINKWKGKRNNCKEGVLAFKEQYGRLPKQEEYIKFASENKYYQKLNYIFDDFNDLLSFMGVYNERQRTKFDLQCVCKNIKYLSERLGHTPTSKEYLYYAKKNKWCTNVRYYYTWNKILEECKLEVNSKIYSKDEVERMFIELKNKLGRIPKSKELSNEPGYPNAVVFIRLFGSYTRFLMENNYIPNHREKYTNDELKVFLEEFIERFGDSATRELFNMQEGYPYSTIYSKNLVGGKKQ